MEALLTIATHFEALAQTPSYTVAIRFLWIATSMGLNLFLTETQIKGLDQRAKANQLTEQDRALIRTSMSRLANLVSDLKVNMPQLERVIPLVQQLPR